VRLLERFAIVAQTTAFLGPANLLSLLLAACLAGLLFGYRLVSQGYHRCLLTIR
jgi:hypothetical protein